MRATVKNNLPAMACAATLLVCYFLIRPYAEIGINDDWSYIKTAQVLAQTGRIAYNGWASPMLGWQVFFGALFIKVFGFSFTAVRFTTVIEAMATAWLLQRTWVRAGLNSWNAALATLALVLSPLYFPFAFTFMSDISGVLSIVVCLYMCLRAIEEAESERAAAIWIGLAALLNAAGGTARQFAWLGLLVMVPSTLWLLRRKRRTLVAGCVAWAVGVGVVWMATHWFAAQPYTVQESAIPDGIPPGALRILGGFGLRTAGQLALLALPVLLAFAAFVRAWNRRAAAVLASGFLAFAAAGIALIRAGRLHAWLAPFFKDYITDSAFARLNAIVDRGFGLQPARNSVGALLTGAIVLGILGFAAFVFESARRCPAADEEARVVSWQNLGVILGPFSAAYLALLTSLALQRGIFDRYLMPLLAVLLFVLARLYQERVKTRMHWACALLIAIFAAFSIAATHDEFSLYRGYVTAIEEVRGSGAPANTILGPSEFVGWTEIEQTGFINQGFTRMPQGVHTPQPGRDFPASCSLSLVGFLDVITNIKPAFAVSENPGECGGQVAFPPVEYRTWIAPHTNWIYDVRLPARFSH